MEWNILEHNDDGYVEIVTNGVADGEGSMKMAKALAEIMQAHRLTKALIDHRNVEYVIGNKAVFDERPKAFRGAAPDLGIKIAEIIRPEHRGHFQYLETIFTQLGHQVSIFQEKDPALAWLLAGE